MQVQTQVPDQGAREPRQPASCKRSASSHVVRQTVIMTSFAAHAGWLSVPKERVRKTSHRPPPERDMLVRLGPDASSGAFSTPGANGSAAAPASNGGRNKRLDRNVRHQYNWAPPLDAA